MPRARLYRRSQCSDTVCEQHFDGLLAHIWLQFVAGMKLFAFNVLLVCDGKLVSCINCSSQM